MIFSTQIKRAVRAALPRSAQLWLRSSYLAGKVARGGIPPEADLLLLDHLVQEGDAVADIGANIGVFTHKLSLLVGSSGSVMSFEPVSTNFTTLTAVIRKGALYNVQAFHAALGGAAGRTEIVIPESAGFEGLYEAHLTEDQDIPGVRETVEVLTLDSIRKGKVALDFIKCDVEGHELHVLTGAREVLETARPGWLLEVSRKTNEQVFERFLQLGYKSFFEEAGKLQQTDSYCDGRRSNYFFLHPESKVWSRAQRIM